MRRRISRALLATAAAGATITTLGFAAMGSASAATAGPAAASHRPFTFGSPIYTPTCDRATNFHGLAGSGMMHTGGCAGYVGTGRDFRYAQALIKLPAIPLTTQTAATPAAVPAEFSPTSAPALYIGLSSNDTAAGAGLITCDEYLLIDSTSTCTKGTWIAFAVAFHQGTTLMTNGIALPSSITPGQGIKFAIYYNQLGNALHFTIDETPAGGAIYNFSTTADGAVFTNALALADFSAASPQNPGPATFPSKLITRFNMGAWTTASGDRGTFVGPWTTQRVSITYPSGNPPPGNQVVVRPGFLWNDGLGNGWGDAFGVWWLT